ncbi:threonine/serine exporter family protein [Streptomyces sp. NPDC051940]|uniref:threonine/serine ThrE exporter family protein n=1 Tax=Streptomyces sp. NPDC051940 TaxID=3155675 RepID=UPI003413C7D2
MAGDPGRQAGGGAAEEEGKPLSDEAHSAFTPPLGVPLPPPAEDEHPTSEFAIPDGVAEPAQPEPEASAFTQPAGTTPPGAPPPYPGPLAAPLPQPWQDRMRVMLRTPLTERPAPERVALAEGEAPLPVPRILDLTLRIGELLLAGGEGAEDVEAAMLAVGHAFGLDRIETTVTFTLLSVTHQPSLVDDPVTVNRTVRRRGTDYNRLAAVFRLVDDITDEHVHVTLEEAYRRLAEIRRNRHPYPKWALTLASGLLAGAAAVLVGGGPLVFFAAAVGAMAGDRLAWLASARGLPEFYQFVFFAVPPAAIGVALKFADVDVRYSAVITGGLFALLPGRALVAAVQDGLTGYYITASARLLEVLYLFVGIIVGVLMVLYVGVRFGAGFDPDLAVARPERPVVSLLAAMALTATFAVLLQQDRSTLLVVSLNGGVAWLIFGAMHDQAEVSPVFSTGVAAGLVGLFGQLLSRYRYASALPYVTAAIGPLLPGSATYFGLLGLAQGDVNGGIHYLLTAATLALAIAVGVNLGGEMARLFLSRPGTALARDRKSSKRTRGF